MNYLDKYKITNKNSKFFGRYAWMIDLPNENNSARFILDSGVHIRLKMSSVQFASSRFPDGYRFKLPSGEYEILQVSWNHDCYRVKRVGAVFPSVFNPWMILTMKAQVV